MRGLLPDYPAFETLARHYQCVPVVQTLVCDRLTPLGAFACLAADSPRAFLLDSVVGGESVARYSFVGVDPAESFAVRDGVALRTRHASGETESAPTDDPLGSLEEVLRAYRAPSLPGLPRFLGGAVGYAGYDTARYYEPLPHAPPDDRGLPDLLFDIYDGLLVFDHVRQLVLVSAHAHVPAAADAAARRRAYDQAAARVEAMSRRLDGPSCLATESVAFPVAPSDRYTTNFARPAFEDMVRRCQEYIRAGDIFQVVPSQRLRLETAADPLSIYRALRVINPSPFMFFLKNPDAVLVGASPEIMCRVEGRVVTTRPLAGTRPRGADAQEDRRLAEELLADPKERAEHIMLVDLGRNDVGRVCRPGSVRLSDLLSVEYYSHVMHLSSTVTGELVEGGTAFDALRATLPVGTVSGAPKVRAMQIIDDFEPTRRGPYGGAVGYIDFAGNADTCIALRTMVLQPASAGRYRADIQVGAGIVADSVPAKEYQETLNKAQSLLAAVRLAEEQFTHR